MDPRIVRWASGVALAAALVAPLGASSARAQDALDGRDRAHDDGAHEGADDEARGLFLAGQAAFEAARYEDALAYFRRAYERSARPELLYNVAIAADRLRRDEDALEAFERFLADAPPEVPQRRDVEARVAVLREALAARERAAAGETVAGGQGSAGDTTIDAAALAPPSEPESALAFASASGPDASTIGGWSLVGGGAAVAIGGMVLLGVGRSEAARVESAAPGTPWPDVAGAAANAEWMSPTGIALIAVGATAVAGGAVWLALAGPGDEHAVRVGLAPGGLRISGEL